MPRIPERLPTGLSERLASASQAIYSRLGREVDVAVGGIPFMLATAPDVPQSLETIPVRKEQLDPERDPGEQSLTGWWRRSQSSFHQGAGFKYEPLSDEAHEGYWDSSGVYVFERNDLTLINRMNALTSVGTVYSRIRTYSPNSSTAAALTMIGGGDLYKSTTDGNPTSAPVVLHNPATTLVDGLISGATFYSVASDGTLYKGLVSSPGTATTWPCGTTPSRMAWGKHRLWIIGGPKLWNPDLSLAGGTAQNPIFTHPNDGWTYTCIAEGPASMFFGGHDGYTSSIQSVTLDAGGGVPTLSGATATAVLPEGELVQEIAVLAGQFIGIGTNRGFRVGVIQDSTITYGPLLIEPDDVIGCTALTTQGRFFVVGFNTTGGDALVYRIDTGTELDTAVFPYAKDASCGITGYWTSATSIGNLLYGTTSDGRVWNQHATEKVSTGYLETSRIRYRTTEPKAYKYLDIDMEPLRGAIGIEGVLEGGSLLPLGSISAQGEVLTESIAWGSSPMRYASLKFTFTRDGTDATRGPNLHSYLVRALPAVAPQHLITLPLLCFDQERARSGQVYGADGYCADRLAALLDLEKAAETLVYQEFTSGASLGITVVIESLRFVQTTPRDSSTKNSGGILYLQLRTVDA